jgi:competence protein ComEA
VRVAERRAQAGFAIGVALLAAALPGPAHDAVPCSRPMERSARAGRTHAVACAEPGVPGVPLRGPARRLFGMAIDPNTADGLTLETLPGIGPSRAEAIVRERCRRSFWSVADLQRVPGIGPRTLARLAPLLAVEGSRPARCGAVE